MSWPRPPLLSCCVRNPEVLFGEKNPGSGLEGASVGWEAGYPPAAVPTKALCAMAGQEGSPGLVPPHTNHWQHCQASEKERLGDLLLREGLESRSQLWKLTEPSLALAGIQAAQSLTFSPLPHRPKEDARLQVPSLPGDASPKKRCPRALKKKLPNRSLGR